ncbi:exodeoxyribonuclease V subunit gamma [Gelidibacter maritimus]|uniref:Exodeoxyribonuclease V subunit gamma n=1 Tax=Gelidibacter maritimus TaxID=2761487 RepID=A0A7W2M2G3_9FLAO|nr:exodeoxyribonuclease V subunit gamma [Gelidibacter maritimus]MBA6151457.1 exodeoxyribonuclease V subunit gamma [Gelidibacter maritimus]
MSIQVYASRSIEPLAKQLSKEIKEKKSILYSDFIVSDNKVTTDWLKVVIAEENGIAAHLTTCSAKEILSIIYRIIGGKNLDIPVLNSLQQQWIINELLNDPSFTTKFTQVAAYYLNKPSYQLGLSDKVAALFDQYSLYIPDKLKTWNADNFKTSNPDEKWQQHVWLAFQKKIKDEAIDDYQLHQFIEQELDNPDKAAILKEKLPVIYLFNIAGFNSNLLELFIKIGNVIDVKIFYDSIISEVKSPYTNDLLENLKGPAVYILETFKNKNIEIQWLDRKERKPHLTLLQSLQNSILEDKKLNENKVADFSLIINSCYSPIREVEVLYNYLVKSVDLSKNYIGARNIVVYCSNLDKYAPAISAVFDNTPYHFPYHIIGEKEQTVDSSIDALAAILQIDIRWMKPSLVMQLLEYSSIVQKYEIEDVDLLLHLVKETNIRNGFNGEQENETNFISWEHGLKRLNYGMLISGDEWFDDGDDEYLTLDKVEGNNANDLVRFNYFIQNLHIFLSELENERCLEDWISFIQDGCDLFFDRENDIQLELLTKELAEINSIASSNNKLGFEVFYAILKKIFKNIDASTLIGTNKGIRFCSISNSNPIPNTVVALLGLNLTDFPRQLHRLSYDLIKSDKESILQDIKEKDKSFFLKAILSAKKQLYISYIGRSSKDNSELPPSSLVDALLDYLDIKDFVTAHPLHNFNSKYYKNNPEYYSYLGKNQISDSTEKVFDENKEALDDKRKIIEIPLHEFINFFKDSFKNYYNKQLGIYYNEGGEMLEDSELFELDTLQKWNLKRSIVDGSELTSEDIKVLKIRGNLPLGTYGEICLENIQDELRELTDKIEELTLDLLHEPTKINYELQVSNVLYRIRGQIDSVFINGIESKHIFTNVSSSQQKYQFEAFINFLFLSEEKSVTLEFLCIYNKILKHTHITYSDNFIGVLDELIKVFISSQSNLNPFYINEKIAEELLKIEHDDITKVAIENALEKDGFLSDYVSKEREVGYFEDRKNQIQFLKNYHFLNELIFKNFNQ